MTISELCYESHRRARESGWWNDRNLENNAYIVPALLALIHSEVSEAMEGYRKNLMDDKLPHRKMIEVELADVLIRIGDLAAALNLDLAGAISEKWNYNAIREDHKLEVRANGGKRF